MKASKASSCSSSSVSSISIKPLPSPWSLSSVIGDGLISKDLQQRLVKLLDDAEETKKKPTAAAAGRSEEEGVEEETILPSSNNAPTGKLERVVVNDTTSSAKRLVERLNFCDSKLASELGEALRPALPSLISVDCISGRCTHISGTSLPPLPHNHQDKSHNNSSSSSFAPDEYDEHMGPFAGGEWALSGVDHHIQLFRYPVGGIFTKHRDGPRFYSEDCRTFFTVLIYLNDTYRGGRTTVFSDDQTEELAVEPKSGRAFVMLQRTLHQGSEVTAGVKDCLRCDILYRRCEGIEGEEEEEALLPDTQSSSEENNDGGTAGFRKNTHFPSASESIQHLGSNRRLKALHWKELGLQLESSGQLDEAVEAYRRATKLVPSIMDAAE